MRICRGLWTKAFASNRNSTLATTALSGTTPVLKLLGRLFLFFKKSVSFVFSTSWSLFPTEGSTQVEFPQKGQKTEAHTPLAPFHTRYLFVDSGPKNDIYCIQDFRTKFEVWLSNVTFRQKNCDLTSEFLGYFVGQNYAHPCLSCNPFVFIINIKISTHLSLF